MSTGSRLLMNNKVHTVRLANNSGTEVELLDHGASIQSFRVPTAGGRVVNAVLGYDHPEQHLGDRYFLGSTVGRFAGRIRNGVFDLNGRRIELATDTGSGGHCLHGGPAGFHSRTWSVSESSSGDAVVFSYKSPDGDQGFPGELNASISYRLQANALIVEFAATSSADTVVNLANHAYFNLGTTGYIDEHEIRINADSFTPLDAQNIPSGVVAAVGDTNFDFRQGALLGHRLASVSDGFDHNFKLNKHGERAFTIGNRQAAFAASAYAADTGLTLNIYTTQPGLQFYTGQNLDEPFEPFQGFCLEAQAFPDSPNQPTFPSTELRAGDRYHEIVVYELDNGGRRRVTGS